MSVLQRVLVCDGTLEAGGEHSLDACVCGGQRGARDAAETRLHVCVHRVLGPADAGLDDSPVSLGDEVLQLTRGLELLDVARRERGDGGVVELDDRLGDDVACGRWIKLGATEKGGGGAPVPVMQPDARETRAGRRISEKPGMTKKGRGCRSLYAVDDVCAARRWPFPMLAHVSCGEENQLVSAAHGLEPYLGPKAILMLREVDEKIGIKVDARGGTAGRE